MRLEAQAPPYALVGKPSIKKLEGPQGQGDLARRPEGHHPHLCGADAGAARHQARRIRHGVCRRDLGARVGAAGGAVDAAILLPPFNFQAEAQGFTNLGLTVDYAPELPFSGTVVNKAWAAKQQDVLKRMLAAHTKSVEWFYDDKNRAEAIAILVDGSEAEARGRREVLRFLPQEQVLRPHRRGVAEEDDCADRRRCTTLGDVQAKGNIERFVMPGVTQDLGLSAMTRQLATAASAIAAAAAGRRLPCVLARRRRRPTP